MQRDRTSARIALQALRPPEAVLRIFDDDVPHAALRAHCQSPYHVFNGDVPGLAAEVIPLWERGVVVTAYAPRREGGAFVTFSLEDPADVRTLGRSFGAVVADLLLRLWEDEMDDATLEQVAELLEFGRLGELLGLCDARTDAEGPSGFAAWRSEVLARFDRAA